MLCRRYGSLFVLDEVQTGLCRTGPFLAAQHFDLEPDMVVLAKALSGGLIPNGAVLLTDAVYRSVYGSLARAFVHTSTFSENGLAMRAGLATLDVLDEERLGERAERLGRISERACGNGSARTRWRERSEAWASSAGSNSGHLGASAVASPSQPGPRDVPLP